MPNETFTYPVLIRECHLDTFGHVNNATYLALYEEARWEFITQRGFGLKEVQKNKIGPTILELDLKFFRELKNRTEVVIETICLDYPGKVGRLKQTIKGKTDGVVFSEVVMAFGLFDLKERKLILPTPEWKRAIGLVDH